MPVVRTPDGKTHRFPVGATPEQIGRALKTLSPPAAAAPPPAPPMSGVVGGSSSAPDPRRAVADLRAPAPPAAREPLGAKRFRRGALDAFPQTPGPIERGFTGTIYGGNVAGAGGTIEAAGAATGIRPVEAAGQAIRKHGERFQGAPAPPDIFQIDPSDPVATKQVLDYLGYVTGSGIASSAPSIAGGVVGGLVGGPAGAVAGAAIPAYLMNTGGVMQEIEKIGGGTPAGRARLALVVGLPVTALDVISAVNFSGKLTRFLLKQATTDAARPLVPRVAIGGLKGAGMEGGTEGLQNVVQDVGVAAGTEKEFDLGETARGAALAMGGGALTGGVLGGGTSILPQRGASPAEAPNARSEAREARRAAAAPPVPKQLVAPRRPMPERLPLPAEEVQTLRVQPPVEAAPVAAAPKPAPPAPKPALKAKEIDRLAREHAEIGSAEPRPKRTPERYAADQTRVQNAPKVIADLQKRLVERPNDQQAGRWRNRIQNLRELALSEQLQGLSRADRKAVLRRSKEIAAKGVVDTQPASAASPAAPAAVKPSGSEPAVPKAKPAVISPPKVATPAPKAPSPAPEPSAPARVRVDMQFGDEAAAQRVAVSLARSQPGSVPVVVPAKKGGFTIEVNADAGTSRLKKQSFVKVTPKNPAPDVAAAAAAGPAGEGRLEPAAPSKPIEQTTGPAPAKPKPPPAVSGVAVGQRVVHQPSLAVGEVVSVKGGNVVIKTDTGSEVGGSAALFRALPDPAAAKPGRRNLPKVPAKGEDLARQGRREAATEQATARSGGEPPAGLDLVVNRGTSGTRNYKPGETLTVPYTGKSKKLTSERGVVQGFPAGGKVTVLVRRGKSSEIHTFLETQVRRRPKADRRGAEARNPKRADEVRAAAGGDVEKARGMVERASVALDKALTVANNASAGDRPKLLAQANKARDAHEIAQSVLSDLEHDPTDWGVGDAAEGKGGDTSFDVDAIMKGLDERGFVNLADLRDAIEAAIRRISGMARRDPVLKNLAAKRPPRRSPEVELIIKALKEAGPIREKQAVLDTAEKKRRVGLSKEMEEGKRGMERLHARKASQKGELPTVDFESVVNALSHEQIQNLTDQIFAHPALSFYEQLNAGDAFEKLLGERGGRIPQPAELDLLEIVFGGEFVDAVMTSRPLIMDLKAKGYIVLATSRALRSSFDMGASLRQGLYLGSRFPKLWAKSFAASHFHWWSKTAFEEDMDSIVSDPLYKYARQGHLKAKDRKNPLSITRIGGRNLSQNEEAFLNAEFAENMHEHVEKAIPGMGGKIAAAIPHVVSSGVRRSNQAYVGFLNRLRFESFKELWRLATENRHAEVRAARKRGVSGAELRALRSKLDPRTNPELLQEITRYVNSSSGRGDSKFIDNHVQGLNATFFSARLQKSRIELLNPRNYIAGNPFVRRQYLTQMRNASAGATLLLTLAAWMGAKVEWDSLNADWGKVRVGKVVYDVLGGLTQYLRFYPAVYSAIWEQMNGRRLKVNRRPVTVLDLIYRFVSGKYAPVPAVVNTWFEGYANSTKKKGGGRKKLHYSDVPKDVLFLFVPMIVEDFLEVWKADERLPVRAASVAASNFGISVQSYDLAKPKGPRAPQAPTAPTAPSAP